MTVDGKDWEISHEEVLDFDCIMAEIIYKRYHNDVSYACLKGEVRKIYTRNTYVENAIGAVVLITKKRFLLRLNKRETL